MFMFHYLDYDILEENQNFMFIKNLHFRKIYAKDTFTSNNIQMKNMTKISFLTYFFLFYMYKNFWLIEPMWQNDLIIIANSF